MLGMVTGAHIFDVVEQWFPTLEEVSGVPPNIEFTTFFSIFTTKGAPKFSF